MRRKKPNGRRFEFDHVNLIGPELTPGIFSTRGVLIKNIWLEKPRGEIKGGVWTGRRDLNGGDGRRDAMMVLRLQALYMC